MKKKMISVSKKVKNPKSLESFRAYIGRKVISKSGEKIGKVHNIRFSGTIVSGFVVSKLISKFFVGIEYLGDVSEESIVLSIDPVTELIGKHVFDADGRNLGKVARLNRKGTENNFDEIVVKKRIYSKGITIPKKDIDVMKKNIILNTVYN